MKNILLLILFAFLSIGSLYSQDKNKIEDANYCILLDGKVFAQVDGKIIQLEEPKELNNGTIVNPDGSYMLSNKSEAQLKDGQCIGFSGKLYESQEKLNQSLLKQYKKLKR